MCSTRPEDLNAYDLTLRAVALFFDFTRESFASALELAREAITRDPRYARAHAFAAWALFSLYGSGGATFSEVASEALGLVDRALRADRSDPHVLSIAGLVCTGLAHDLTKGISLHEEALTLNPNDAWCLANSALLLLRAGDCRRAIEQIELAMRLSPRDHFAFLMIDRLATGHLMEGDVETAYRHAVRCVQMKPDYWFCNAILASTAALLGKEAEATAAATRLWTLAPGYAIADRKGRIARFAPEKWEIFF
jgi:tetratricopeptide (TPR) repeat protein